MRGLRRTSLTGLLLLGLLVPAPPATAEPSAPSHAVTAPVGVPDGAAVAAHGAVPELASPVDWPFPEAFPRTSGVGRLAAGALEWTDFLYDDHGATGVSTNAQMGAGGRWKGTYSYASPAAHGNGADIFRLGVGVAGGTTHWRVDWVTLDAPGTVPILSFGIVDPGSAADVPWPGGAGVTAAGLLTTVTVSARGAWLVSAAGTATPVSALGGSTRVDLASRSFLVALPRTALPALDVVRVLAVSGVADANGSGFAPVAAGNGALPGQPAVYNVGFRTQAQEPPGASPWMESAQAAALTAGDISAFGAALDWRELAAGRTTAEPQPTGYTNRWYVSSHSAGEGIVMGGASASDGSTTLPGRLQPYAAYVPQAIATGTPLPPTLLLHALGYLHNMYAPNPRFLATTCEQRGSICLSPSGRSPSNPWYDDAELDLWEVWRDAASAFPLDPERAVIAGYSMGGLGATRLGLAYPGAFTQIVTVAGGLDCGVYLTHGVGVFGANQTCRENANFTPLLPSARWTPVLVGANAADYLSPVVNAVQRASEIAALEYRYRLEVWTAQEHLLPLSLDTYASIGRAISREALPASPDRVSFAWYPRTVRPERGLVPSSVHWLGGLVARDPAPGVVSRVEATSAALAGPVNDYVETAPTTEQPEGEVAKVVTEGRWNAGPAPTRSNALTLALTGVQAVRVDGAAAGLTTGSAATVEITTDGSSSVELALTGLGAVTTSSCTRATVTTTGGSIRAAGGTCSVTFAAGTGRGRASAPRTPGPTPRRPSGCDAQPSAAPPARCAPQG